MNIARALLLTVAASSMWAGQIANMQYITATGSPGFFIFEVDGDRRELVCDQFFPPVTTSPYQAIVATLDDLTGTALERNGDPMALMKYQQVGMLVTRAYEPGLIDFVVEASRFIVDGGGPVSGTTASLLAWVQTQNPADYDFSNFRIYANPDFQEQTGYLVPEPSTWALMVCGSLAFLGRRKFMN